MYPITLIIDCHPNEGMKDIAVARLQEIGQKIKAEKGCMTFDILQSQDETSYVIYETWLNENLWAAHLQSDHMKDFSPEIGKLFKIFDIRRYGLINE